jgi:hypothetical protein
MNHSKHKKPESLSQRSKSGLLGPHSTPEENPLSAKNKALHYSQSRDDISGLNLRNRQQPLGKPQDQDGQSKYDLFQTSGKFCDLKMTFNDHLQMEESNAGDR